MTVYEKDVEEQFFIEASDIGQLRANVFKKKLHELNPLVEIDTDTSLISEIDEGKISKFSMVIATQLDYEEFCRINELTRICNASFYATSCFGLYGFAFCDLINHNFAIDRVVDNTKVEEDMSIVQKPMKEAFQSILGETLKPRLAKKIPPLYPAMLSLLKSKKSDPDSIRQVCIEQKLNEKTVLNGEFLSKFSSNISFQWTPVMSVVGGVVSQDALNSISKKQFPIDNFWIFDAESGLAPIYRL